MNEIKRLLEEAKEAVKNGDLEKATALTNEAKALTAILDLEKQSEPEPEPEPKQTKADNGPGRVTDFEDEAERAAKANPWKGFGEFLNAVRSASEGSVDKRLLPLRSNDPGNENGFSVAGAMGDDFVGSIPAAKATKAAPSGIGTSLPQAGGVLVGSDRNTAILSRVYESGQLLSRVAMDTVGPNSNGMTYYAEAETSRATGSRRGGVRFYWAAENSAVTTSAPTFREMELKLKKAAAAVYVTEEQLQDTAAMESYVMRILPEEIRWGVEDAILNGTGAGQPLGLENAPALISVPKEVGQDADTVVAENVINMWARLWGPSKQRAIWLISQDVEPQLMQMSLAVGTGGSLVYTPPGGLSAAPYANMFGRPVIVHESCDNVGDVGDIWLVDPTQYQMIEKGGIQSASSIHVRFLQGESVYRFIYRVDGQPIWNSALTPFNGGATVGPFVTLAERA